MINVTPIEIRDQIASTCPKAFQLTSVELNNVMTIKEAANELLPFNSYIIHSLWVQYSQEYHTTNYVELNIGTIGTFLFYLGL